MNSLSDSNLFGSCDPGEFLSILSPPESVQDSSKMQQIPDECEGARIHVSTMFYPGAPVLAEGAGSDIQADLLLVSSDSVFFYAHSHILLAKSSNFFGDLLLPKHAAGPGKLTPPLSVVGSSSSSSCDGGGRNSVSPPSNPGSPRETGSSGEGRTDAFGDFPSINCGEFTPEMDIDSKLFGLPETSDVLNVLLHTLYSLDCTHYSPTLPVLLSTVRALKKYGADPARFLSSQSSSALFSLILSYAPSNPLEVYAFAASWGFEELATHCSTSLLSLPLHSLSDDICVEIGAVYLKKLFFLHLGRIDALKRLLLSPPTMHPPTGRCTFEEQNRLTRAWALASSYLLVDARPDTSVGMIEGALLPLGDHLWCEVCRTMLTERVKVLVAEWEKVKKTI